MGAERAERLFLALWPGREVREALSAVQREYLPGGTGRRVPAGNLHLTLAFLGAVERPARARLEEACSAVRWRAFALELDRLGSWPRAGVAYSAPLRAPAALQELYGALHEVIVQSGLPVESRPLRPHVTLARKLRAAPGPGASHRVVRWPVDRFVLVRSTTDPAGARYEPQVVWPSDDAIAGSGGASSDPGANRDVR